MIYFDNSATSNFKPFCVKFCILMNILSINTANPSRSGHFLANKIGKKIYHARETIDIIKQAILHRGFSLVDVYSICPTYYGRKNKKGDAVEMLKWQKENLIPTARFYSMSEEERAGKKLIGILSFNDYPEYTDEYAKVIAKCRKAKK